MSVGSVTGAVVEPGLVAAVQGGVAEALAARGATSGPPVEVVVAATQAARAAIPAASAGTVAWEARVSVAGGVPSRPGCHASIEVVATWVQPTSDAADQAAPRAAAVADAARRASLLLVDLLTGTAECRSSND